MCYYIATIGWAAMNVVEWGSFHMIPIVAGLILYVAPNSSFSVCPG